MSPTIDIYVSGGQHTSSPFYTFYTDDAGTQEFTSHLKIGTTYTSVSYTHLTLPTTPYV